MQHQIHFKLMGFLGVICGNDKLMESQNTFSLPISRPSLQSDLDQNNIHEWTTSTICGLASARTTRTHFTNSTSLKLATHGSAHNHYTAKNRLRTSKSAHVKAPALRT